jgi:hypothetical protein
MDEFTADAWHDLLGDVGLDEARAAVVVVAQRQPFAAASEIRTEVKRARGIQAERQRTEALVGPVRRRQLEDARPLRETIRELMTTHGRKVIGS